LQRIVLQNDLSVNSKLFGFAGDSCHQALAAEHFVFPRGRSPFAACPHLGQRQGPTVNRHAPPSQANR
jgi:hypothetical protein